MEREETPGVAIGRGEGGTAAYVAIGERVEGEGETSEGERRAEVGVCVWW
jgi:hypothetical protein